MKVWSKACLNNICKYFQECTANSSIHGVKFVGDRKRSSVERIIWLMIWITSVVICSKYVMQTYDKWQSSPVFVTIGTGQVPIHDIAFPAVTICPESNIDSDIFYYPDLLELVFSNGTNLTETEKIQLDYMTMICNRTKFESGSRTFLDKDILNFFHNVTLPVDRIFKKCRFAGITVDCTEIFAPVFYKDGICYSFNSLDHDELFHEDIQRFMEYNNAPESVCFNQPFTKDCKDVYPKRASFSGINAGLEVELTVRKKDLDFLCASALQGYQIILHDPSELPTPIHNQFRLPTDQAVFAAVTPEVIITERDLKSYPAVQRKCFFDDEKTLKRFRYYSQVNCEAECLMYMMDKALRCLEFYLPHTNDTENICGPGYLMGLDYLNKLLVSYITGTDSLNLSAHQQMIKNLLDSIDMLSDVGSYCNCLPSCSSTEYAFETTQTDYHWREFNNIEDVVEYRSMLNIYFKQSQFIPMQRKEMFGSMDFIAYCGGLLGLFIGFSFISLIEVIYFLSLRIGCNVRMYGRNLWHESDN